MQATLNVIGRRDTRQDRELIDLIGAHLPYADLRGADLSGAAVNHANLFRARLSDANLADAELFDANLAGADLIYTNFTGANLFHAIMNRALLAGAILTRARLAGVDLTDSMFTAAYITRRSTTTIAESADFTGADLADVAWPSDVVVPEGWQRDRISGRLKQAGTSSGNATDPAPTA